MADLNIPLQWKDTILPPQSLSVLDFLNFPLPMAMQSTTFTGPSQYFSMETPNISNIQQIHDLPMPPKSVVDALLAAIQDVEGMRSIMPSHIGPTDSRRFPVWIVQY
jgi:hypothetical protein